MHYIGENEIYTRYSDLAIHQSARNSPSSYSKHY